MRRRAPIRKDRLERQTFAIVCPLVASSRFYVTGILEAKGLVFFVPVSLHYYYLANDYGYLYVDGALSPSSLQHEHIQRPAPEMSTEASLAFDRDGPRLQCLDASGA